MWEGTNVPRSTRPRQWGNPERIPDPHKKLHDLVWKHWLRWDKINNPEPKPSAS